MEIETFFDPATNTLTYVTYDGASKDAVIIDPVLDYDPKSGTYSYGSADKYISFVKEHGLKVHYIIESHAHADHLSSSAYLKEKLGAKVGIGANITKVQELFKGVFNLKDLKTDGSQFDQLFEEGEEVKAGSLKFKVIFTPGHTPACASYLIEDAIFTGDALFMPDFGTGRCDFPAGSASDLFDTVKNKLYTLPDETRVFVGHDYGTGGRPVSWETTIGESKKNNVWITTETTKDQFVEKRTKRDETLDAPVLIFPSVQVNINAGLLPKAEDNGTSYLKIPLTKK